MFAEPGAGVNELRKAAWQLRETTNPHGGHVRTATQCKSLHDLQFLETIDAEDDCMSSLSKPLSQKGYAYEVCEVCG